MNSSEIRKTITEKIVSHLENGVRPWRAPWLGTPICGRPLRCTGEPYRGINVLLLWMEAMERGLGGKHWMTFRQAKKLGGQVRKGEKSTLVVLYKPFIPKDEDPQTDRNGDPIQKWFMRGYRVFNTAQIDGLPDEYAVKADPSFVAQDEEALANFSKVMAFHKPKYQEVSGSAYYRPSTDTVHWPPVSEHKSAVDHAATGLHELGHWTGAEKRLNRPGIVEKRNADRYAFEELVAELTAAFCGSIVGIPPSHIEDHSAYISHWIKLLEDPKAILKAAGDAERATQFILPEKLVSALELNEERSLVAA